MPAKPKPGITIRAFLYPLLTALFAKMKPPPIRERSLSSPIAYGVLPIILFGTSTSTREFALP